MARFLTPEGLKKLKKELDYLKNVKRREIAEKLRQSISFGDLTENAAYQEAKDEQSFVEGRISEIEDIIRNTKVVESMGAGWVEIGSTVWLSSNGEEQKFQIVGANEANPFQGKISYDSPLGKVLLDKPEGAVVETDTPSGKIKYKILKIV